MKTRIPRTLTLAFALTSGLTASLTAQTTPTAPPADDQPILLTPFSVSVERDQGYVAVDSLAGGRQNTPLRVTPSAVSAMTKEFISDLGVTDLQSALSWSLNAVPTNFRSGNNGGTAGDTHNFWSISIRGDGHVQGGNPPTKNYFPTYQVIDMYNVERIETNSGPNSILFGIGDIGGSLTTYTKTPQFNRNFNQLNIQATNFGGYRTSIDTNGFNGPLAVRVNALYAKQKGWRDGDYDKRRAIDLGVTYKFTDDTQLRFDIEGWSQERNVYTSAFQDGVSLYNGSTAANTWGEVVAGTGDNPVNVPGAPGVKTMDAWGGVDDYRVFIAGTGTLMNWAHGLRSAGVGDFYTGPYLRPEPFVDGQSGRTIVAAPSREFAIAPPDSVLEPESLAMTLSFEHRFNANSELQIQGYKYEDTSKAKNFEGAGGGLGYGVAIDLNKQLPNGQTNPNYGKRYSDFFLDKQNQNHRVNEIRGQYTYHFDTTLWNIPLKQTVSVSAGHQVTDYDARQYQAFYRPAYDANNWTRSMVWGRVYWDNPQAALNIESNPDIYYGAHTFNWYDFNSTQKINYGGLFSQTRLWDDRLNISLGIRRDDYKNTKKGIRPGDTTNTISEDAGNTYSAGVVGYVTEWLAIVGNLSSNFQPAAGGLAPAVTGKIFGPSFGKGRDIGLRISTKDAKYYATVNYYNTKSTDVIGADQPDFQGIWNQYFKAGGTKTDIGPAGSVSGQPGNLNAAMNSVDTFDVKYHGVEVELTANPTRNLRISAHYSKPQGEHSNDAPNARIYFAQHLPDWQAAVNTTGPENIKLAQNLADAQKKLDAIANPTITPKLVTSMYNAFAVYSFLDGAFKGLEIGGGATYLGEQYGGAGDIANGERIKSPAYSTWTALIAYSMQFSAAGHSVKAKFQLNVDNVLDNDKLIYTSYQTFGTNGIQGGNYRYLDPRKFTFSANFAF
jgi:outer membrane receptor protein involved in Fe transport